MPGKEISFKRKLIMAFLCLTLPLIILLIISNVYSTKLFNSKIADSNMRTMYDRVMHIEDALDTVDDFMTSLLASSVDFRTLSAGASQLNAHLASYALFNQLKVAMPAHEEVGAFFIYSAPSGTERDMFTSRFSYPEKTAIRAFVRDAVSEDRYSYQMRWRHAEINGISYLFRFYGGRGTYLAAMIPLEHLEDTSMLRLESEAVMLFVDEENQPLTGKMFIRQNDIDLDGDYSHYFISGRKERFMILGQDLSNTDCRAILAVSGAGYFHSLNIWQILLFASSILVLILIPFLQMRLTRSISDPVEEICSTMQQVRAGKLDAKVQGHANIREFREMNETFNGMMAQIQNLKIESYEHEIETQKAQLRYLQLQIRPHFFLNCLKSLYALAESGKYDRIQKMILQISKHIRYIFTDSLEMVPLSRELDHIRNYIEMQGDSSQHAPVCRIEVDPLLIDLPIPPLSLQTFVENSIKHDYSPDHPLEIDIRVSILRCGKEAFADLTVADNGSGFPESVIQEINDPDSPLYTQRHVGINNIKKRMNLTYGDGVLYAFFNRDVGSVSEIFLPIDLEKIEKKQKKGTPNP